MITKEIISKIKITFQVTKACILPVTLIVMSAFPTLIHEACQVFGVSYYIQNGGMMALVVCYVVQFKAIWLAMGTLTVQTQSDF